MGKTEERKVPSGADIIAKLIELYADQIGVKITYQFEGKNVRSA